MISPRTLLAGTLPFLLAGCVASAGRPEPDLASARWRALVGCYDLGDSRFTLDSLPDTAITHERGIRVARFTPRPIVGGYWFVTAPGVVWVSRHDGLWGRTYEFRVRGDSLVGRSWVRTDVPTARPAAEPAAAVRTTGCSVAGSDAAG
jgi:hypothetical protein